MTAGSGSRLRTLRPLSSACLLLLFLILPALIAGVRIDAPASPGELHRVEEALNPEMGEGYSSSPVARMYYGMTVPAESAGDPEQILVLARRAQLLGILGLTCLLYLSVSMVRSRSIAVLACLALAALPPVWSDGHVLRPEVPAALFGSLSVLLLQGMPVTSRARHGTPLGRGLSLLALMSAVGIALGLAVSALNTYKVYLLLPSAMLFLALVMLFLRFSRLMRRRGVGRLPVRAFALGLLPWVGAAFFTLLFPLVLLSSELGPSSIPQPGTVAEVGLLPDALVFRLPLIALGCLGGVGLVLRTGTLLGRTRRLSAASVLLVYTAILLAARMLHGEDTDSLPAAPALAVLIAEGIGVLLVLTAPFLWRRRTP